jgi:hypothetical protein
MRKERKEPKSHAEQQKCERERQRSEKKFFARVERICSN